MKKLDSEGISASVFPHSATGRGADRNLISYGVATSGVSVQLWMAIAQRTASQGAR